MASATSYIEAVGRRKTASARVRVTKAKENKVTVNEQSLQQYFGSKALAATVMSVFDTNATHEPVTVSAKVHGGGIAAQAEAIRLGIARALVKGTPSVRTALKSRGFLKRDPRAKERRKFGLKKARKRAQWSKR
jgi:small subunit ribosomal protein S9